MKKFLSAFVILAAVLMVAPYANAAPTIAIATFTVAAELIPTASSGATPVNATAVTIGFSGVTAVAGANMTATLTNATWATTSVLNICTGATSVGTGTTSGTASAVVTLAVGAAGLSPGTTYTLQPTTCTATPTKVNIINIANGTPTGQYVTLTLNNAAFNDPNIYCTANVLQLVTQFTAKLTAGAGTIGFTGTTFTTSTTATLLIDSNDTISQAVAVSTDTSCAGSLNGSATVPIVVTGNLAGFQGYTFQYGSDTTDAHTILASEVTAGSFTMTIAGANLKICSTTASPQTGQNLTFTAPTTPVGTLQPGTLAASVSLAGGTTAATGNVGVNFTETLVPTSPMLVLSLNFSFFQIPYLSTSPQVVTACLLNNAINAGSNNPNPATVSLTTLSSEAGGTPLQSNVVLGTIALQTSQLITFSGTTVQMGSGTPVTINIPANTRYEALLNVNNSYPNVTVNCIQTDPVQGPKRLVPVLIPSPQASPGSTTPQW